MLTLSIHLFSPYFKENLKYYLLLYPFSSFCITSFFFLKKNLYFTQGKLIYRLVIISSLQQWFSVCMYNKNILYIFLIFFSIMDYHRVLNIAPSMWYMGFPGDSVSKESTCKAGDYLHIGNWSSVPGLGRSPGEGNGNPLQYSCLRESHGQRSLAGYSPWDRKSCTHLATKPPPCDTVRPCCLSILYITLCIC